MLTLVPLGAAMADDDTSIPGAAVSWTGLYVGGHVGYGTSSSHWTHESISPYSAICSGCAITVPGEGFSGDDAVAGGQIGYNFQYGQWVIGPEVSFSGTSFTDTHSISPGAYNQPATTTLSSKIGDTLMVTGRLGFSINDSLLIYGKGGFASADISAAGVDTTFFNYSFDTDRRANGWTAGGGVEYRLSDGVSFAVEYAHLDFGDETLTGKIADLPDYPAKMKVSSEADTVTARLNLHPFN
jgi:outer membrane immunogenic protein